MAASAALAGALAVPGMAAGQSQHNGAPTREDITRENAARPADRAPTRVTVEGDVEHAPCPLADPRYAQVMVTLDRVEFSGLEVVPAAALDSAWRGDVGAAVPVARLCEIRDRAATILRGLGYLAAVQIPPQRIDKGGTVHMDVLMARLTKVQVRGDPGNSSAIIERILRGVAGEGPFNTHEAERRLLLARDLPGFDIRLVLRPATDTPGAITADAIVVRQPIVADINIQNLGSTAVGRYAGLARVQLNGLYGHGDATVISLFNTSDIHEQTVVGLDHSLALGGNGLRLSGNVAYAWSHPSLGATSPIRSLTLIAGVRLDYPLRLSQASRIDAGIGAELIDQRVRFGALPLSTDKERSIAGYLSGDFRDPASIAGAGGYTIDEPRWRLTGAIELRQGVSVLGASKACGTGLVNCLPPNVPLTRLAADPRPTIVRFQGSGEFRPAPKIAIVTSTRAQYSRQVLVSYEEIGAGNYTIGRGYDPGTLLGDSGVGISAELRLLSGVAHARRAFIFQPYGFYDGAWSWQNDTAPGAVQPQYLASVGGGVRGAWRNHARFDLSIAVPLERPPLATRTPPARFLFSITTRLFPWSAR